MGEKTMTGSTHLRILFVGILLALVSQAASAYTLVFKDGSTLIVEEEYRIEGDRLYALLLSGTETFFALDDVDLERTAKANEVELGSAIVLDQQGTRDERRDRAEPQNLGDLLQRRNGDAGIFSKPSESASVRKTPTGNLDFFSLPRQPFRDEETADDISRKLRSVGVAAAVLQGSEEDRILLEIVANTRGEVFNAMTGTAKAYLELTQTMPDLGAMELALATDNRSRAGMFVLGIEDATALAEGAVEPAAFFVENVIF
jgi:hypothetical protein